MKKFLLLLSPTTVTHFPEMAIPSLTAQLRKKNYDVSVMDLNIDFFYRIYNKDFLDKAIKKAQQQYLELEQKKETFYNSQDTYENKILARKYDELNDFFQNHMDIAKGVPASIEKALQIIKNEKLFYNPKLLQFAHQVFKYANRISCLPYAPFDFYGTYETYYEDLCKIIFNKDINIFMEYFEEKLEEIKNINADYIGISISYRQQLIAGLTLAYLLKKHTKAHINIGGNYFSRLTEFIPNYKDFFDIFTDSISIGEGENSIIELARYIEGEIDISEVPQFMYKDKNTGEVKLNNTIAKVLLSRIQQPDYSDLDLNAYFLPEKVFPLQLQRGCYWNRCAFCAFSYAKTISAKKMEDVIEELKYNLERYGVRMYMIIDEAVTPKVLEKLADAVIANKMDVRFFTQAKLEKDFDYKLLKKLFDAGFRNICWGLETTNKRVQALMNKGVSLKYVPSILKNMDKIGILNYVYCMCGFPTATYDEDMETYKFITTHSDIVHLFFASVFGPVKYSPVYNDPDKYKIRIKEDSSNTRISLEYQYEKLEGATYEQSFEISDLYTKYYINNKFKYIFAPYYYIMYTNKFGLKYVKKNLLKCNSKDFSIKEIFNKIFSK